MAAPAQAGVPRYMNSMGEHADIDGPVMTFL
jgi:hypothetical protein